MVTLPCLVHSGDPSLKNQDSRTSNWFEDSALVGPLVAHCSAQANLLSQRVVGFLSSNFVMSMSYALEADYWSMELVFAPTDMGVPTCRARKYTVAWRLQEFLPLPGNMNAEKAFRRLFARPLIVSAKIYLQASEKQLAKAKEDMASKKGCFAPAAAISQMSFSTLLRGAERQRLMDYRSEYRNALESSPSSAFEVGIIDLAQTVAFMSRITYTCPALLRHSNLHDLISDRPLEVGEAFIAMGFPVPEMETGSLSEEDKRRLEDLEAHFWPWSAWSMTKMPSALAQRLIGNGMHMRAVGRCRYLSQPIEP